MFRLRVAEVIKFTEAKFQYRRPKLSITKSEQTLMYQSRSESNPYNVCSVPWGTSRVPFKIEVHYQYNQGWAVKSRHIINTSEGVQQK